MARSLMRSLGFVVAVWQVASEGRAASAATNGDPLTADALVRLAVDRSPPIQAAAARVRAAQGKLKAAGVLDNPDVEGTGGSKTLEAGGEQGSGRVWELKAPQRFPFAGKRSNPRTAARGEVALAELALKRTTAETRTEVQVRAVQLVAARELAEIARSHAGRQRRNFFRGLKPAAFAGRQARTVLHLLPNVASDHLLLG